MYFYRDFRPFSQRQARNPDPHQKANKALTLFYFCNSFIMCECKYFKQVLRWQSLGINTLDMD